MNENEISIYSGDDKWKSGPEWSNEKKPWSHVRPFHRIHSPSYDPKVDDAPGDRKQWRPIASGKGCECGCHSKDDYQTLLLDDVLKMLTDALGVPTSLDDLETKLRAFIPGADNGVIKDLLDKLQDEANDQLKKAGLDKDITKILGQWAEGGLFGAMMAKLPAWVAVEKDDELKELEGIVWNSFLDVNGVPLAQWHRWYDWNFHVIPFRGYAYLQSEGNGKFGEPKTPESIAQWVSDIPDLPLHVPWPMECRWDTGAIGDLPATQAGPAFRPPMMSGAEQSYDPATDWMWPQPGQYVWLAGRWVYNCQNSTKSDADGLMRSELHPCRSIATARWEAVKFDENPGFVPAIQFMFFASTRGGYIDSPKLAEDATVEFIVDLPPLPEASAVTYPVGSTHPVDEEDAFGRFELNTLVLRPRLLTRFEFKPFQSALGAGSLATRPIVELLGPAGKDFRFQQAKVTVPVGALDTYGVVASLGWHDPGGETSKPVKRVTVRLRSLEKHSVNHDKASEQWRVNISVNGRWVQFRNEEMHNDSTHPLATEVVLRLHEDEFLSFSAHGTEQDGEGNTQDTPFEGRKLKHLKVEFEPIPGKDKLPAPWDKLPGIPKVIELKEVDWAAIDNRKKGEKKASDDEKADTSGLARDLMLRGFLGWIDGNDRLGMINPNRQPTRGTPDELKNRIQVKDLVQLQGEGAARDWILVAYEFDDERDSAELQFHLNSPDGRESARDYTLHVQVKVEPEPFPAAPGAA